LTRQYTMCIVQAVEGKTLRRLRRASRLTQAELAKQLGVTPNTVARWERGEVAISDPMARLISLTLGKPERKRGR
jgi:transcriptional regulator with XRE-family HTH domain